MHNFVRNPRNSLGPLIISRNQAKKHTKNPLGGWRFVFWRFQRSRPGGVHPVEEPRSRIKLFKAPEQLAPDDDANKIKAFYDPKERLVRGERLQEFYHAPGA